jgi:hypothetical protein
MSVDNDEVNIPFEMDRIAHLVIEVLEIALGVSSKYQDLMEVIEKSDVPFFQMIGKAFGSDRDIVTELLVYIHEATRRLASR